VTSIILMAMVGAAVVVAARYAYLYAKIKERHRSVNQMLIAHKNLVYTMKDAIEKEHEVSDIVKKLEYAKTENDINAVYLELITGMRQQDGDRSG